MRCRPAEGVLCAVLIMRAVQSAITIPHSLAAVCCQTTVEMARDRRVCPYARLNCRVRPHVLPSRGYYTATVTDCNQPASAVGSGLVPPIAKPRCRTSGLVALRPC